MPDVASENAANDAAALLLRFAVDADIDGLYKFRSYDNEHRERVNRILLRNRIYFSPARFFNDPFDPRPRFYYESVEEKRPPLGVALAVRYSDDYPLLRVPVRERGQEAITTMLLRKSSHWTYEREYRLIRFPPDAGDWADLKLTWEGTSATLPPKTITGISLGADMENDAQAALLSAVRAMPSPVPVYKARLHASRYELQFDEIA